MKHTKKNWVLALALMLALALTACTTTFSYTFNVDSGDTIKVELNTTEGYRLKQDRTSFSVEDKNGQVLSTGYFQYAERIKELFDNLEGGEGVTILEKTDNSYFYEYDQDGKLSWNYVYKFNDEAAGLGVTNAVSEESARTVIDLLTFTLEE